VAEQYGSLAAQKEATEPKALRKTHVPASEQALGHVLGASTHMPERQRPDTHTEVVLEEEVRDGEHLAQLLGDVFGVDAPAGVVEAWERSYRRRG
jgi:hypothetical protein